MFFVAFEGIDGCGKSTHSKKLRDYYRTRRWRLEPDVPLVVEQGSFPRDDSVSGQAIRSHLNKKWQCQDMTCNHGSHEVDIADVYREGRYSLDPLVFQCLQTTNRLECLPSWAWEETDEDHFHVLIADRYQISPQVYGRLDGLDQEWLDKIGAPLPQPNLYILLDIPVEESVRRKPKGRDRYESDLEYMEKIRKAYRAYFEHRNRKMTPTIHTIIQAHGDSDRVFQEVVGFCEIHFPTEEAP